ncbi:MAG: hypothetical protein ORN49_09370 [Rhodobacteraceae bacterium]|nr:hypothetical protein [Paracoccaceae bacterium]
MAFTAETIAKDNICVIWVDDLIDMFTWRTSFGIEIKTPNLDRLMARGCALPMPMPPCRSARPAGRSWPPACRPTAPESSI